MDNTPLHIPLTAWAIEEYCQTIVRHTSRAERRIAALDSLKTFIATMASPAQAATDEYAKIIKTLNAHFEQSQEALLTEQLHRLHEALQQRSLLRITTLYTALSRDAFWQRLEGAGGLLDADAHIAIAEWSGDWLEEVRRRSAEVSPYPDMIDFKTAGIEVAEYTSMSDIHKFFSA